MEALIAKCCFQLEWRAEGCGGRDPDDEGWIPREAIETLVGRGVAVLNEVEFPSSTTINTNVGECTRTLEEGGGSEPSGDRVYSLCVKERYQASVSTLPIGARTLLLERAVLPDEESVSGPPGSSSAPPFSFAEDHRRSTGSSADRYRILLRGLNKFPAVSDIGLSAVSTALDECVCSGREVDRVERERAEHDGIVSAGNTCRNNAGPSSGYAVYLQRKMAGFILHCFSMNGRDLLVVSKHSPCSAHAKHGSALLTELYGVEKLSELARDLHSIGAVLSGECVDPSFDHSHPVEDRQYGKGVWFFALQAAHRVPELSYPTEYFLEFCRTRGLQCVPTAKGIVAPAPRNRSGGGDDTKATIVFPRLCVGMDADGGTVTLEELYLEHCCDWECSVFGGGPGEGFVLLIEVPSGDVLERSLSGSTSLVGAQAVGTRPTLPVCEEGSRVLATTGFRIKLKCARYQVVRSLRSIVLGESTVGSSPSPSSSLGGGPSPSRTILPLSPLARGFLSWAVTQREFSCQKSGFLALQQQVREHGILSLLKMWSLRSGGQNAVADSLGQLTTTMEFPRNTTFVMFCGLPGSGKSSIIEEACNDLGPLSSGYNTVIVSRDEVQHKVFLSALANRQQSCDDDDASPPELSAHKQRRLRKCVHEIITSDLSSALRAGALFPGKHLLVVYDACNADPAGREHWLQFVPPTCRVLLVNTVADPITAAQRAVARGSHLTLSPTDVQGALYKIGQKWKSATQEEVRRFSVSSVLTLYTSRITLKESISKFVDAVQRLHSEAKESVVAKAVGGLRLTLDDINEKLSQISAPQSDGVRDDSAIANYIGAGNRKQRSRTGQPRVLIVVGHGEEGEATWREAVDDALGLLCAHLVSSEEQKPSKSTKNEGEDIRTPKTNWFQTASSAVLRGVSTLARQLAVGQGGEDNEGRSLQCQRLEVEIGCTRWLYGILRYPLQLPKGSLPTSKQLLKALCERYNVSSDESSGLPHPLHVTLAHRNDGEDILASAKQRIEQMLGLSPSEQQHLVELSVTALLIDTVGVCLEVDALRKAGSGLGCPLSVDDVDDGDEPAQWTTSKEWFGTLADIAGVPTDGEEEDDDGGEDSLAKTGKGLFEDRHLHLTVGLVEGAATNYCATQSADFLQWQEENADRQAQKQARKRARVDGGEEGSPQDGGEKRITCRQLKMHNFARVRYVTTLLGNLVLE